MVCYIGECGPFGRVLANDATSETVEVNVADGSEECLKNGENERFFHAFNEWVCAQLCVNARISKCACVGARVRRL